MAVPIEDIAESNESLEKSKRRLTKWLAAVVAIALVLATCMFAAYAAFAGMSKVTRLNQESTTTETPLSIVTRNEWLAQPPKADLTRLNLPVDRVIILHTATENCHSQLACTYRVRFIQEQHIGINNYVDIGYNFLIGGDGQVYEGRGWQSVGTFLRGQNSKSEGIAFIGDYRRDVPTEEQMNALDALLENGTRSGYLTNDFKLYGARQWQATESPGQLLYDCLKKHKHWSDES